MRKTFKYKLYQSKKNRYLHQQIEVAAEIYNYCIALHKRYYRMYGKFLGKFKLQKHLTKVKKRKQHWLLGSQAIQDIVERINRGYQLFFRNVKKGIKSAPPTFRKRIKYKSFTLKQAGWKLIDGKVKIGKKIYGYHNSRPIEGDIKTVTIKRDTIGDFYIFFSCICENSKSNRAMTGKSAGFDFGLKTFLTASDGTQYESPQFYKQHQRRVQKANQKLSRKKKGSNNRIKARLNLARTYRKITNQRKDHHFKLAHELMRYDCLFFETLNMKGMQQLWGRKISDLGFSDFISTLHYVASKHEVKVHHINKWYPSSKTCHCCGQINQDLTLKDRTWTCLCGTVHDRDLNAARNILREGASSLRLEDVRPDLIRRSLSEPRIQRL